jgi:hypothetical protein
MNVSDLNLLLLDDLFGELDNKGVEVFLHNIKEVLSDEFDLILYTAPNQVANPDITVIKQHGESFIK